MHPTSSVAHLLASLFSRDDLLRFLSMYACDLVADVRTDTLANLADDAAAALHRRGRLDAAFFDALATERPNRVTEIQEVQRALPPPGPALAPLERLVLHVAVLRGPQGHRWTWTWKGGNTAAIGRLDLTTPLTVLRGPRTWEALLGRVTGGRLGSPEALSARVLLHTDDAALLALDWRRLPFGPTNLADRGQWTVELAGPTLPTRRVELDVPVAIDLVGEAPALRASLVTMLQAAWPAYAFRDVHVRTPEEVGAGGAPIRVVVGAAPELPPATLEVRIPGGPWQPASPSAATAVFPGERRAGEQAAIEWLRAVLTAGEAPGAAWHRLGHGLAHTRYLDFHVNVASRRPQRDNIRRRLDRLRWRSAADGHLKQLVTDASRRVLLLTASGEPGNLVGELFTQVEDWALRTDTAYELVVAPGTVVERRVSVDTFDDEVRVSQGIEEDLVTWVQGLRRTRARESVVVVLLLGLATAARPVGPGELRAVAEWARDRLTPALQDPRAPRGTRALVWLAAEVSGGQPSLHPLTDPLRRERAMHVAGFDVRALEPLSAVEQDDIVDFLKESANCGCPPELAWDIATAVHDATAGRYEDVVAILERLEELGWHAPWAQVCATGSFDVLGIRRA